MGNTQKPIPEQTQKVWDEFTLELWLKTLTELWNVLSSFIFKGYNTVEIKEMRNLLTSLTYSEYQQNSEPIPINSVSTWEKNCHWGQDISTAQLLHHCSAGPQVLSSCLIQGLMMGNGTLLVIQWWSQVLYTCWMGQSECLLPWGGWRSLVPLHKHRKILWYAWTLPALTLLFAFNLALLFGPQWCWGFATRHPPAVFLWAPFFGPFFSGIRQKPIAWIFAFFCSWFSGWKYT